MRRVLYKVRLQTKMTNSEYNTESNQGEKGHDTNQ